MIGIDIGGANLKVVDESGVHIHYCPLWEKAPISEILSQYQGCSPAAVVMSGELADCFSSKNEGIEFIVDQVKQVFPHALFYGIDGKFHQDANPTLAAANWLAMADFFRSEYPDSMLIDMGSTTTDIIPLNQFDLMLGQTDLTRLQQGYLVYCGLLRTNVATLIPSAVVNGIETPVSTEYFASTGDAFVVLGKILPEEFTAEPADHKGTDTISCQRRLARVVCADIEEIKESGVYDIAKAVIAAEEKLVSNAVTKAALQHRTGGFIIAGVGAEIAARWTGGYCLNETIGEFADALPAYAVRKVLERIK